MENSAVHRLLQDALKTTSLLGSQFGAGAVLIASAAFPLLFLYFRYNEIRNRFSKTLIGNLSFLAAGALLSLGIVHIMPEATEGLAASSISVNNNGLFNYAWTLTAIGVALVMVLEHVTHTLIGSFGMRMHSNTAAVASPPSIEESLTVTGEPSEVAVTIHSNKGHEKPVINEKQSLSLLATATLTAIVLFVHALFDGAIIGTRRDIISIWITTGVICSHKIFVAFSLGMSMLTSGMSREKFLMFSVAFIISSPVGIILFALLPPNALVEAIVGCLATSSVIYISFEMLFGECAKSYTLKQRTMQIVMFILGISLLVAATVIETAFGSE
ncbi:metal cation transporter, ZIP family protein [Cardiosporidium cionae]|uniref:Metal cation transporter, ZIP family protein n=1 Tax=Cardiosporidium cionae TaxID=476202 RepID=A0ABQ7J784_9APIC|nr:metal cation transporter, ZIP family protein [Cardiosporidium cionae]|eukprot:KAF8819851.1 metal cation transporter, ZIP family protein [Cardiosporidium cionae]